MSNSLWGEEFVVEDTKEVAKKISKKIKNPETVSKTKKSKKKDIPLEEKMNIIRAEVYRILGKYKENTVTIRSREDLTKYIDAAIENGEIAIDTETNNSLDPLTCKLMGPCIYTPGQKNAYIPINHISPITGELLPNQLTEKDIREEFLRLVNTKIIMHNGKFDYKVIKCTCDVELEIYWDTMVGAKVLDENESAGLKQQYISKIDNSIEKYSIEHLFEDVEYALFEPELFALYAATDAFMTYKLYKYQIEEFNKPGNERLYNLFREVETPLTPIIAEMELRGVAIDLEYSKRLSKKFHKVLDKLYGDLEVEARKLDDKIAKWRQTPEANLKTTIKGKPQKSKNEQLTTPINFNSSTQLAILLYDVLGIDSVDKKSPRSTSEDSLKAISEKIDLPILNTILSIRGMEKLLGTYVDKIPTILSPRDGRLHGEFLQFGADTGRFSSKNPNLQNIPARGDNSVRRMFKATEGYTFVGSDYS